MTERTCRILGERYFRFPKTNHKVLIKLSNCRNLRLKEARAQTGVHKYNGDIAILVVG